MVRANQNKSHRSNKGVRMYRKIKPMTALHGYQQVLAKEAAANSGPKRSKTKSFKQQTDTINISHLLPLSKLDALLPGADALLPARGGGAGRADDPAGRDLTLTDQPGVWRAPNPLCSWRQ